MNQRQPTYARYAVVVGLTACALLASLLLKRFIEPNFFLPFTAVVLVSSWFYGRSAGLLGTTLGTLVVYFIFPSPHLSLGFNSWTDAARLLTFVMMALLVTFLMDELRQSKMRLAATLSSIGDAVVVTDKSGLVVFLNPVAEALLGWTLKDARRKPLGAVLRVKDEQTGEPAGPPIESVLSEGSSYQSSTHKLLVSKDGHEVSIEESAAPIREENGHVSGAILIFRDITARRQLEDQMNQSQKMEAVGRLAAGVAGDFNNLLTVITGYGEMLRTEMSVGNPLRRFAEEILYAAERAAGLTRQLVSFGRGQTLQPKILDLNSLLKNMDTMLRRLIGEQVELVIMPGPGLGRVKADAAQLEQVVVNLAMNSRDAMPKGGRFVVETANVDIDDSPGGRRPGIKPGQYIMLVVSDTGVGMDAATRSRLFEPFFTTKGKGKGSGLGLSIVYSVIQQSQGFINVYSQVGAGTIFEIYLPREKEMAEPVRKLRGPRGSETILIADDEDGVRKLVHAILATNGYTVIETRDGREALTAYESNRERVDMVLTDIVMPHINGLELGERLSTLNPRLRILYMSGYRDNPIGGSDRDRQRLFLHKPFTPDALLNKVREVLDAAGEMV